MDKKDEENGANSNTNSNSTESSEQSQSATSEPLNHGAFEAGVSSQANRFTVSAVHKEEQQPETLSNNESNIAGDERLSIADGDSDFAEHFEFRERVNTGISQYTQSDLSRMGMLSVIGDTGSLFGSSVLLSSPSYWTIGQEVEKEVEETRFRRSQMKLATSMEYLETIMENAEYIDTVKGKLPLAEAAKLIAQDRTKHKELFNEMHVRKTRRECYKKLVCIGFGFLALCSSFFPLRNLQSSNSGSNPIVGLITFGSLMSLTWLGGLLCNTLLKFFRPKWIIVISSVPFVLYACANFYPSSYTLIPSALFMGLGIGLFWSAEGVYLINLAATYAFVSKKPLPEVISKFNAVIFTMYQSSHLVGNLLSSLVLSDQIRWFPNAQINIPTAIHNSTTQQLGNYSTLSPTETPGVAICGLDFYSSASSGKMQARFSNVSPIQMYVLVGILTAFALGGSLNFIFLLKPLKTPKVSSENSLRKNMANFIRIFCRARTWFLVPYLLYPGWSGSLLMADYTKAYITCAYGVSYIGYVLMTGACFSVAGAFVSGRIVHRTGRLPIFLIATISTSSAVAILRFWQPVPGALSPICFIPICLWSLGDGILLTQINGFLGEFYRTELTFALSALHLCFGFGAALGTMSSAFKWFSLAVKTYITFSEVWIAFILFVILERLLKLKKI